MMKILILRNTVADGADVEAGQVVDVRDETARYLLQIGKASDQLPAPKPVAKKAKASNGAD